MYVKTVSREELKSYFREVKARLELNLESKVEVDLEPIIKLLSKVMTAPTELNND